MMLSNAQGSTASLQLIEDCLTLLTFGFAFVMPKIGSVWFSRIERPFIKLARRKDLSVAVIGLAALLLRLALLPLCPIPLPFVPDDFSFLLSADTFVHGRLTNPTPPMWVHFETIHVSMVPTYMSMYFPAQGLLLASGRVLFGHPWFGLLIMSGIMCAAFCWMLQAWLPPSWALLGGIIAVMRLGLFSYWINTYTGAGSIAALGGALVLGALPRLIKTSRFRYAVLLAVGIILVGFTRPYEGLLLCLPVAFVLGRWVFTAANRPAPGALIRLSAFPLAIIVAAAAWSGYYDYRAFGNPFTLPYSVNRAQYAMAPYFVWQSPRPEPVYRHAAMRNFYHVGELDFFSSVHSVSGFLPFTLKKIYLAFQFYAGLVLCVPLIMLRRVFLDRRIRFLIVCVLILSAGMSIQIFLLPHYLAPFAAAFYAIGLQAMRHLRLWKPEGKPVGVALTRGMMVLCVLLVVMRMYAGPLHVSPGEWPASGWNFVWYGPAHFGTERARVASAFEQLPGQQLAIVRYTSQHQPFDEWVYNAANIDGSKVIWAREMDTASNQELVNYYPNRKVWLVEPDAVPATVSPYPQLTAASK
jgi:hypothetical protein